MKMRTGMIALAAGMIFLAGCSEEKTENVRMMFVHASHDAPAMDIYAQGELVASGVEYGSNSGYLNIAKKESEQFSIDLKSSGSGQTLLSVSNPAWNDGDQVSFLAYGEVDNNTLSRDLLMDEFDTPPSGKALVRFVHLSPDGPVADILLDETVTFSNINYLPDGITTGFTAFTQVNAGSHEIAFNIAGTSINIITVSNMIFESGKVYTVILRGLAGGAGNEALAADVILNL